MSIKVKLNRAILEQALLEVDGSTGATATTPAAGASTSATPAAQGSLPEVSAGPATAALPAQPAKPVTPGSTPAETSQPGQSGTIANASTGAQLTPAEKVPEAKPQVDTGDLNLADQSALINGCLVGLVGLLNRQDAGGVYLKAIADNKNASPELKKAASDFAAIKSDDLNAILQGFATFANACSAELLKLAELKPAEGEAAKTEEKPADQNAAPAQQ